MAKPTPREFLETGPVLPTEEEKMAPPPNAPVVKKKKKSPPKGPTKIERQGNCIATLLYFSVEELKALETAMLKIMEDTAAAKAAKASTTKPRA